VRYFGRELVFFCGDDGLARLFDAHCPHLGAHLGYGGRVCGDGIRCPFHGWCFDGTGRLIEVPRLDRKPPNTGVRSYPLRERGGMVFAWFHARGEAPGWEVAEFREGGLWGDWKTDTLRVRTHVQDMGENIVDLPHFYNVHDMEEPADKRFEPRFEGPYMIVEQTLEMAGTPNAGARVLARTVNSGPGVSVTTYAAGPAETLTLVTQTPIDEELAELSFSFCMRRLDDEKAMAAIEAINRDIVLRQFSQDIPIWENRIYREKPILTAVDGPIVEYRRWFRPFYSDLNEERRA
jgi:nitrite reductase/ring-hydroxylating ferredoxin subunit